MTWKGTEKLTLDSSGTVALGKGLDFIPGDHIVVAFDGVLQTGGSDSKIDDFLIVVSLQDGSNQTAAERITTADSVDDSHSIFLGSIELVVSGIVEHGRPVVITGGDGLS